MNDAENREFITAMLKYLGISREQYHQHYIDTFERETAMSKKRETVYLSQYVSGLSDTEKQMLCSVINNSPVGGKPYADEANLPYFSRNFAVTLLDKTMDEFTVEGRKIAVALIKKIKQ